MAAPNQFKGYGNSRPGRVLGLSRFQKVEHLHANLRKEENMPAASVSGKYSSTEDSPLSDLDSDGTPSLQEVIPNSQADTEPAAKKEEPPVDAPPLSDSESSDGLPARGEIGRSTFGKVTNAGKKKRNGKKTPRSSSPAVSSPKIRSSGRTSRKDSEHPEELKRGSENEVGSTDVKSEGGGLGDHFMDDMDRLVQQRQQGGPVAGSQTKKSFGGSLRRKLQGQKTFSSKPVSPEKQKPKFMVPEGFESDTETNSAASAGFVVPTDLPARISFPQRQNKHFVSPPVIISTRGGPKAKRKQFNMPDEGRKAKNARTSPEPPPKPRPAFQIPELFSSSFDAEDSTLLPADEGPDQDLTRDCSSLISEATTSASSAPICPMCNEEVDKELLDNFKPKRRHMSLQEMQQFCLLHKETSARTTWMDRGYPDIKWTGLEERMRRQHPFLKQILEGGESHFGDIFSQKVKTGQNKNLRKLEESLTPGYYGVRGFRAMSEHLVREFSSLLRKRSVKDRLVSARGHTLYVQCVLVPELAVRLIMEDMDVRAEEARVIMTESKWVGELLNEELADVVLSESEGSDSELSPCPDSDRE